MPFTTPPFWYRRSPSLRAQMLRPLALLYALATGLHRGWVTPLRLPVPVVSIGNITLGGTGKTPLVIGLARELQRRGLQVAVLTRGYGSGRRVPIRLGDRREVQTSQRVGDEALELLGSLPEVPVWVGADRRSAARQAVAEGAALLLLDDGLQHWPLARDCDVTVLDERHGLGNGLLFPAGPLREPAASLGRADLLVLTGTGSSPADGPDGEGGMAERSGRADPGSLGWPAGKPWLRVPATLHPAPSLRERPLLAFCGIGLPRKFFAALRQAGLRLVGTESFPDHHPYAQADLERLVALAQARGGATLVTTVKDWQRLPSNSRSMVAAVPLVLEPAAVAALADAVLDTVAHRRASPHHASPHHD
ncbi:tetraacyldisaccharide 4'-kinase [Cyanobium sp. NIES-981]|uniref:tetraacyldisaccharide 4'-kinase n=1 Tax=Cyanobium sp. NIES-981 TaxID=1851505 RepID=UPI0007DDFC46|nr:tetraacyldisaccharide 4'-kinase [Cyanobium sp. NIES-981]SBO43716.1 Tetraacyldisaccharide 4'-kinase [Cyanobium sp. NIES-981]